MSPYRRRPLPPCLASMLAAALLLVGSAGAQPASSALSGLVVDGEGRALGGVEVVANSPQVAGQRRTRTDEGGGFMLPQLPPGRYGLSFELAGHQWVEYEMLRLEASSTLELRVTMVETSGDESVLISGGPSIEAFAVRPVLHFRSDELAVLPAAAPDAWWAPLVDESARSPCSDSGQPLRAGSVELDGHLLSSPAGAPPQRAVAALAMRGEPGHRSSVVQLITKSGGPSLRGELRGSVLSDGFAGGDLPAETGRGGQWTPGARGRVQGSLGGPLGDRLWFFSTLVRGHESASLASPAPPRLLEGQRETSRSEFFGRLWWQRTDASSLGGSVQLARSRSRDELPDPYFTAASDPRFAGENDLVRASLDWQSVVDEDFAFSISGHAAAGRGVQRPERVRALLQDLSVDGRYSGGLGNGVFMGGAGFSEVRHDEDDVSLALRSTWAVGLGHRLQIAADLMRRQQTTGRRGGVGATPRCVAGHPGGIEVVDPTDGGWTPLAPSCDSDGDGVMDGVELAVAGGERWQLLGDRVELLQWFGADDRGGLEEALRVSVEDSWTPHPGLSIQGGVELEWWQLAGSAGRLELDLTEMVSPHLAVAWDFEGNGRSRAYLRVARERLAPGPQVTDRLLGFADLSVMVFDAPQASADDPLHGAQLVRWRPVAPVVVPDKLAPRTVDELVVGLETEILSELVVGLSAAWSRRAADIVALSVDDGATVVLDNLGRSMHLHPVTGAELGEAVELPAAVRDRRTLSVFARRRLRGGWQLLTTLRWARVEGNLEAERRSSWLSADSGLAGDFVSPESLAGARGPLPEDRRWQLAAMGSRHFQWGLELGAVVSYQSGAPRSRLGALSLGRGLDQRFVGRRGDAGRSEGVWQSALRLAWPVPVATGELELWLEAANLGNRAAAVLVDERWTVRDESAAALDPEAQRTADAWGQALVRQQPRRLELGVGFRW